MAFVGIFSLVGAVANGLVNDYRVCASSCLAWLANTLAARNRRRERLYRTVNAVESILIRVHNKAAYYGSMKISTRPLYGSVGNVVRFSSYAAETKAIRYIRLIQRVFTRPSCRMQSETLRVFISKGIYCDLIQTNTGIIQQRFIEIATYLLIHSGSINLTFLSSRLKLIKPKVQISNGPRSRISQRKLRSLNAEGDRAYIHT